MVDIEEKIDEVDTPDYWGWEIQRDGEESEWIPNGTGGVSFDIAEDDTTVLVVWWDENGF